VTQTKTRSVRAYVAYSLAAILAMCVRANAACDAIDVAVTTTPAPPATTRAWHAIATQTLTAPEGGLDLLIVGDSLAAGWQMPWARPLWGDKMVFDIGIGGEKTQEVLWRLTKYSLRKLKPKNILLVIGTNNIGAGDKACAIERGIDAIIAEIKKAWPAAKIQYASITQRGKNKNDITRRDVNVYMSKNVDVRYINTDEIMKCDIDNCDMFMEDQLHYSRHGYDVITAYLIGRIWPAR
jgi:lysophospholipase L1-like esterase